MFNTLKNNEFFEDFSSKNLDYKYINRLKILSQIFFILVILMVSSTFSMDLNSLSNELLSIFIIGHFYILVLCLTAFLTVSKYNVKCDKLIKVLFTLSGILLVMFFGIFLFFRSAFYSQGLNILFNFGLSPFLFILLYCSVFKKYYFESQILSFSMVVLGLFGFFYFIQPEYLNLFFAFHFLLMFLFTGVGFLFSFPEKGFVKIFTFNTSSSRFSRNVITILYFLVIVMIFLFFAVDDYHIPINKSFLIGALLAAFVLTLLYLLILLFAKKINENDIDRLVAKKEAQEREDLFKQLINYTNDAVLVTNKNDEVVYANPKIYEYYNIHDNIIGLNYLDSSLNMFHNKQAYINTSKNLLAKFIPTYLINNKNNRYLSGYIVPIIKDGKFNGIIQTLVDITEFKEDESNLKSSVDLLNVLLTEVHHRVKNNMQIIISLLNLQKYQIEDVNVRKSLDESQSRIKAMSLVHENLYVTGNFSEINIKDYTNLLIDNVKKHYSYIPNLEIKDNVIDDFIDLDTAIPLGLIINENLTASVLYGFDNGEYLKKTNKTGIITIDLSKNNQEYILKITDNGPGIEPESVKKYGIAQELIKGLTIQLSGKLDVSFTENGIRLNITFPIKQ